MEELELDDIMTGDDFEETSEEPEFVNDDAEDTEPEPDDVTDEIFGSSPNPDGDNVQYDDEGEQPQGSRGGNFYSSIADALRADGILDDEEDEITDADTFRNAIERHISNRLTARQQYIERALQSGVEPDKIQLYTSALDHVNGITSENLHDESDAGFDLRMNLIYRAALGRGFSEEKARHEMEKSKKAGTDIEDAEESLEFLRSQFSGMLENMTQERERAMREEMETRRNNTMSDMNDIMEGRVPMTDSLPKNIRQRIVNDIYRPTEQMADGQMASRFDKYMQERPRAFRNIVGALFSLTNGFKDFSALGRSEANKQYKSKISELERTLQGTGFMRGNLRMANDLGPSSKEDSPGFEFL